jgi:hypothetical protein
VRSRNYESSRKREKDLRQVQGDSPPRRGAGDLFQPEAQAAARIVFVRIEQTILGFMKQEK